MGHYPIEDINPDIDRHLAIVSAYPFTHTTIPTDIRVGASITIQMLVTYTAPLRTAHDNN